MTDSAARRLQPASALPMAVTMGEPAGVGGELVLRLWRERGEAMVPPFLVVDSPARLERLARSLGWTVTVAAVATAAEAMTVFPRALPVLPLAEAQALPESLRPGRPDPVAAPAVTASIARAVALVRAGQAAAVVTNPIQKETLYQGGFSWPGHTEYLAALAGPGVKPVMLLEGGGLRVVPVSIHVSLRAAVNDLTTAAIVSCARITAAALVQDFGLTAPRLALAGLNPHAGENGTMGREDIEIVAPAAAILQSEGIAATGPLPADTLFHPAARATYDVAVCMYHDQALIPLKTLAFDSGVNITLGLPFIRTSPDHGTALNLAGTGTADPGSLRAALHAAARLAQNRRAPG